jgi:hypothetical protein
MPKVQNKIWRCPECEVGIRAPSRIRKVDARRYCLDCTAETGKLVERVCVARETKKRQVSERTKAALERAKETVAKELKLYPWVLYPWFESFCNLDCWDQPDRFDDVQFKLKRNKTASSTWSYNRTNKIIYASAGIDPAEALGSLLWVMAGYSSSAGNVHMASFLEAVEKVCNLSYGIDCPDPRYTWDAGLKVIRESFRFPETSTRQTMPEPKRRKKRAKKATSKKSKVQKAISQREKKAEW